MEALDGLRPMIASRVLEQHDDLSERTLQFRHLAVLRTGARKFRASFFADPWVAAQATKRQQRLAQIPEQALGQVLVLERTGLLEFMDGISDQDERMGETEPITVQVHLLCGLQHECPHGIVAQEHAIEFLHDATGGLRAQGVLTEPLMGIDLVDGCLDFQPLVIAQDQVEGRAGTRVEQGGHQSMQFAMTWSGGIVKGVFDDTHQQWPAALFAAVILGIEVGQIGAISELAQVAGHDIAGQATQHMRAQRTDHLDQASRVKATIQQHEHAGLDRAQQGKGSLQFIGPIGAKEGIDHQVGGAFEQVDAAHLRIGSGAMLVAGPTKGQRIGKGVSHVLHRAVDGHQPQAEGKSPRRLGGGAWVADPLEQATQRPDAQLLTTLADRTGPRQAQAGLRPDVAQSLRDLVQDVRDRQAGKQAHGNDDGDDHRHIEGLFALFPALGLGEHVPDEGGRDNVLKDIQVQGVTNLLSGAMWRRLYNMRRLLR